MNNFNAQLVTAAVDALNNSNGTLHPHDRFDLQLAMQSVAQKFSRDGETDLATQLLTAVAKNGFAPDLSAEENPVQWLIGELAAAYPCVPGHKGREVLEVAYLMLIEGGNEEEAILAERIQQALNSTGVYARGNRGTLSSASGAI